MKKILIFISVFFSFQIAFSQADSSSINTEAEHTNIFWDACIQPDSCSYLPLYEEIKKWNKTRYKYAGNSSRGIDCSGLVKKICAATYNLKLEGGSKDIFQVVDSIGKTDLMEGDLVFFKIRGNRISHVGLYLKDGYFVHASTKLGVIISHLDEPYYKKYYYASGRIRNYN
ncbi:MAG: C40 family peptidase [Bacteroidia bacterium]